MKTEEKINFGHKDLLGIENLTPGEIMQLLDAAVAFKGVLTRDVKKVPTLRGRTVVNLFYENSTRTRTSFELAARRLSAEVLNFDVATSSVKKGEVLYDTVETIEALGADYIVLRNGNSGSPHFLARSVKASVINAGDGLHEHPTQALLDAFTIRESLGDLKGLHVALIGDILHSRVARSNIFLLTKLGVKVTLIGPPTLVPDDFRPLGVRICHTLREGLRDVDVIYLLRIQMERQQTNLFPSLEEYRTLYGINTERLKWAKPDAIVMHPGPVNLGVEISRDVMTMPQAKILQQVTNGVAVRMAVFYLLQGVREQNAKIART
ncbi:MAG: aspartate carbamoyltransferase catalytic subunit [Candidatus Sumerlaeia bacterium]|nr:aspartate carbamoyltransferase catalytic subunit [Candidatus Sumerlaeia bacterium]